jgi:hypothetical protein
MSISRQQGGAQRVEGLEALCKAVRTVRRRAGISKDVMKIRITTAGKVNIFSTLEGDHDDDYARLDALTEKDIIESIHDEHPVWHGRNAGDLLRWFKEARRGTSTQEAAERPSKTLAPAGNRSGWEGGWFKVYNAIIESGLLGALPAPAAKAYFVCFCYADVDGRFYISHKSLAEKIGCKAREVGRDTMKILREAGLVTLERAGAPGRASDYRLRPLNGRELERVAAALRERRSGARRSPCQGPSPPKYQEPSAPTIKTYHQERMTKTRARSGRARRRSTSRAPAALPR